MEQINELNTSKCPNFELCNKDYIPDIASYCNSCNPQQSGWGTLVFRDNNNSCAICLENRGREVEFPTRCGHYFCIPCTRPLVFCEEDDKVVDTWQRDNSLRHNDPNYQKCPLCHKVYDGAPKPSSLTTIYDSDDISLSCSICSKLYLVKPGEQKWKTKCYDCYVESRQKDVAMTCACGSRYFVKPEEVEWKLQCIRCYRNNRA